jgi:hypothetical protein
MLAERVRAASSNAGSPVAHTPKVTTWGVLSGVSGSFVAWTMILSP